MNKNTLVPIPLARKECSGGSSPDLENILELYDFFRHQVLITNEKIVQKLNERNSDIPIQRKQELDNQLEFLKYYIKKKAKLMQKCHRSVTAIYNQSVDQPFRLFQDL